ncbi:MAG: hypothetical protein ABIY55_23570 [Kofleriaceae bacterium]
MRRLDRIARRAPVALVVAALAGCGGGGGSTSDAGPGRDAPVVPIDAAIMIDSATPPMIDANLEPPPPPALGVQLHRAGRPAIRALLLGTLATPDVKASLNAAYDAASDPATWKTLPLPNGVTLEQEVATNMAVWDAFDRGTGVTGAGCGNTFVYVGPTNARSYFKAADLFVDDQLYVDTTKPTCDFYLDLEIFKGSNRVSDPPSTCGGRMPTHDVVDVTYSVLAAGTFGLNGRLPKFGDSVAAHADVSTMFPFLGAPH